MSDIAAWKQKFFQKSEQLELLIKPSFSYSFKFDRKKTKNEISVFIYIHASNKLVSMSHVQVEHFADYTKDDEYLISLASLIKSDENQDSYLIDRGELSRHFLRSLVESGKLYDSSGKHASFERQPLVPNCTWDTDNGLHKLIISYPQKGFVLNASVPLFFYPEDAIFYRIAVKEIEDFYALYKLPPATTNELEEIEFDLKNRYPFLAMPSALHNTIHQVSPTPKLYLTKTSNGSRGKFGAELVFIYGIYVVNGDKKEFILETRNLITGDVDIYYDLDAEEKCRNTLEQHSLLRTTDRQGWYIPANKEGSPTIDNFSKVNDGALGDAFEIEPWFRFLDSSVPKLEDAGIEVITEVAFNLEFIKADKIIANVSEEKRHGRLQMEMLVVSSDTEYETQVAPLILELITMYSKNIDEMPETIFQKIRNNKWFAIEKSLLLPAIRTILMVSKGGKQRGFKIKIDKLDTISALNEANKSDGKFNLEGADSLLNVAKFITGEAKHEPPSLPSGLLFAPHDYQIEGFNWLWFMRENGLGGLLGDKMGAGKTFMSLLVMLKTQQTYPELGKPNLFIVGKTAVQKMINESQKMVGAGLTPYSIQSGMKKELIEIIDNATSKDLIITTYSAVRTMIETFKKTEYANIFIDESHSIKNPDAKTTRSILSLESIGRFCISGTPLENITTDIWPQFEHILPGYLGTLSYFQDSYVNPVKKIEGKLTGDPKEDLRYASQIQSAFHLLRDRVTPFILQRESSIIDKSLPPLIEEKYPIDFSPQYQALYDQTKLVLNKEVYKAIKELGEIGAQSSVLRAIGILRDLCCDARISSIGQEANLGRSNKTEFILDTIEKTLEAKGKVLVYSSFTRYLNLIHDALKELGINSGFITGETNSKNTTENSIQSFKNNEIDILLVSLKAGSTALDLPEANTVISADPFWNPQIERQAVGRAHRQGQQNTVYFVRPYIQGSIEEYIFNIQSRKDDMASEVLGTTSSSTEESLEKLTRVMDSKITSAQSVEAIFGSNEESPA